MKDYKFSKLMKHSGLQFTEEQMLRLVEGLGEKGQWRHALSVVHWVFNSKEHRRCKSRYICFIYGFDFRATVWSIVNLSCVYVASISLKKEKTICLVYLGLCTQNCWQFWGKQGGPVKLFKFSI